MTAASAKHVPAISRQFLSLAYKAGHNLGGIETGDHVSSEGGGVHAGILSLAIREACSIADMMVGLEQSWEHVLEGAIDHVLQL